MAERVCLFVDGENFRHSIVDLFDRDWNRNEYLPKGARWGELFDNVVASVCGEHAFRLRTYWYVVEHLDFWPYRFPSLQDDPEKLKRLLEKHGQYRQVLENADDPESTMAELVRNLLKARDQMHRRFNGWRALQDGIAKRHRAIEFRRAGSISYNLYKHSLGPEKAVDVKLATDLITLRDIYDVAVIFSGDQDYVPAVQVVKDSGKTVVNVAFKTRGGKLLPGGARRLNLATDRNWEMQYDVLKDLLGLA